MTGLLALLLLTDARRGARTGRTGRWCCCRTRIAAGGTGPSSRKASRCWRPRSGPRRPGPYQLHAAIAACHSCAPSAAATDWRQIAALYGQLLRYEPTPVTQANRAVAIAMAEGPAAGLALLDDVGAIRSWPAGRSSTWPGPSCCAALDRVGQARAAYDDALRLPLPAAERAYLTGRRDQLTGPD